MHSWWIDIILPKSVRTGFGVGRYTHLEPATHRRKWPVSVLNTDSIRLLLHSPRYTEQCFRRQQFYHRWLQKPHQRLRHFHHRRLQQRIQRPVQFDYRRSIQCYRLPRYRERHWRRLRQRYHRPRQRRERRQHTAAKSTWWVERRQFPYALTNSPEHLNLLISIDNVAYSAHFAVK
ncbi:MAG: hypothetical protein JWN14_4415 [Chthonomonadales bacterium]|nr:hypothetical protein [Chthonomonadales bacterium]